MGCRCRSAATGHEPEHGAQLPRGAQEGAVARRRGRRHPGARRASCGGRCAAAGRRAAADGVDGRGPARADRRAGEARAQGAGDLRSAAIGGSRADRELLGDVLGVAAMAQGARRGGDRRRDPVETAAGEVAQVDFGYVGKLYDAASGLLRKAWVFALVLAFSRRLVARIVFDQKIETWLRVRLAPPTYPAPTSPPPPRQTAPVRPAAGSDRCARTPGTSRSAASPAHLPRHGAARRNRKRPGR